MTTRRTIADYEIARAHRRGRDLLARSKLGYRPDEPRLNTDLETTTMQVEIVFAVSAATTLTRGTARINLRPGARLRIDASDYSIKDRELRRAIDAGRLRPVAGLAALAERMEKCSATSARAEQMFRKKALANQRCSAVPHVPQVKRR
jgi:hypothetical protein